MDWETFWLFFTYMCHHVKNHFWEGKLGSMCLPCQPLTCDKWDTTDSILMKLQGVVHHSALAFSKLLCLAQGGGSNYLANILITSHISHTAGGNKIQLGAHIQLFLLYKFVSGPAVCNILDFSLFWVATNQFAPGAVFLFQFNLLITAGVTASFLPSF